MLAAVKEILLRIHATTASLLRTHSENSSTTSKLSRFAARQTL
jgi:hypothetical protein